MRIKSLFRGSHPKAAPIHAAADEKRIVLDDREEHLVRYAVRVMFETCRREAQHGQLASQRVYKEYEQILIKLNGGNNA